MKMLPDLFNTTKLKSLFKFQILNLLTFCLTSLILFSCSSDGEKSARQDTEILKKLTQYKWVTKFHHLDISDDDDYLYYDEGYIYLYFLADGTGRELESIHQLDSDGDDYSGKEITRITYYIDGNNVIICEDYKGKTFRSVFELKEGQLVYVSGNLYGGLIFTAQPITQNDYKYMPRTGVCGEKLTYTYENDTHELIISGEGEMYDYTTKNQPWHDLSVGSIELQEGVTSVGVNAFNTKGNPCMASEVNLPKSLKKIGDYAFANGLFTSIYIPSNVEVIGEGAFADCSYLKTCLMHEENLSVIGDFAFLDCKKLSFSSLKFGQNLKSVGKMSFSSPSIISLTFEEGVETIGNAAFGSISNSSLQLPNSLKSIGPLAFHGKFSKIELGSGLTEIGSRAFVTTASAGSIYINISTPIDVDGELIYDSSEASGMGSGVEKKWTLFVPKGSKTAYSQKSPYKLFKEIIEDAALDGDGSGDGVDDGSDNVGEDDDLKYDLKQDEADASDSRRGIVASSFAGGKGTSSDPYLISTAAELRYFSDAVRKGETFRGKYIKLIADITINQNVLTPSGDLNGDGLNFERWIPIGRLYPCYIFCGTFDGDNHVISGLYYNRPNGENAGLFGKSLGTIKNVILKDSYFKGGACIGGIVGHTGPIYSNTVQSSLKDYYLDFSGVSSVINCYSYASVCGVGQVGGIVGKSASGRKDPKLKISKCANLGKIEACYNVGGIIGGMYEEGEVTDCCNNGSIKFIPYVEHNGNAIGGIVGWSQGSKRIIKNSINKGQLECIGANRVGGICGVFYGGGSGSSISNCVNIGEIASNNIVGAVVASMVNSAKVTKCYYLFVSGLDGYGYRTNSSFTLCKSMTESELKSTDMLNTLNTGAGTNYSKWKSGKDGYPILEWINEE